MDATTNTRGGRVWSQGFTFFIADSVKLLQPFISRAHASRCGFRSRRPERETKMKSIAALEGRAGPRGCGPGGMRIVVGGKLCGRPGRPGQSRLGEGPGRRGGSDKNLCGALCHYCTWQACAWLLDRYPRTHLWLFPCLLCNIVSFLMKCLSLFCFR